MRITAIKPDVRTLTRSALCAALIAVCSWINIPAAVPFTMQTFAVFLTCDLLGGAAALPVLLYILLGAAGLPVFAGFSGGVAASNLCSVDGDLVYALTDF